MCSNFFSLLARVPEFNLVFISDVLLFEVAVFAFLLPLALDTIVKISDVYKSANVTEYYIRKRKSYLNIFIAIFIIILITMRFIPHELYVELAGKKLPFLHQVASILIYTSFIISMVWIFINIGFASKAMTKPKEIVDDLFSHIERKIKKGKLLDKKAVETVSDVLIYEANLYNNGFVKKYLNKTVNICNLIISKKQGDGVDFIYDQVFRIFRSAVVIKNEEIIKQNIINLNELFDLLLKEGIIDTAWSDFLCKYRQVLKEIEEKNIVNAVILIIDFYIEKVFKEREGFKFNYVAIFNNHLMIFLDWVIRSGKKDAFYTVLEGFFYNWTHIFPNRADENDFEYDMVNYEGFYREFTLLLKFRELIRDEKDLADWIVKFEALNSKILKTVPAYQDYIDKNKIKILDSANKYLRLNILYELIFLMGSKCLYNKRIDYILWLWELKNPPDRDGENCNPFVLPETIEMLLTVYFGMKVDYNVGEGNSGNYYYHDRYFLISLLDLIKKGRNLPLCLSGKIIEKVKFRISYLINIAEKILGDVDLLEKLKLNQMEKEKLIQTIRNIEKIPKEN